MSAYGTDEQPGHSHGGYDGCGADCLCPGKMSAGGRGRNGTAEGHGGAGDRLSDVQRLRAAVCSWFGLPLRRILWKP